MATRHRGVILLDDGRGWFCDFLMRKEKEKEKGKEFGILFLEIVAGPCGSRGIPDLRYSNMSHYSE